MNRKKVYPAAFLIFPLALYTVFFMVPSFVGLGLSFTNWSAAGSGIRFVGLEHFIAIFTNKRNLLVIANTFVIAISTTLLKNLLGLSLAVGLDRKFKTKNLLRTIYFFPVTLSPLIIGLVFKSIFDVDSGVLNGFLSAVGLGGLAQDWLGQMDTAMGAVIFTEVWRLVGQNMVIYLAGLQSISQDYLEAADIDGAGGWQKFWRIVIPQLMPSITINVILNVIAGLKIFDIVFVLTNGGPARATEVMNTVIFKEYSSGRYGFSTAMGLVMFVFTAVIAFSMLRAMSKEE
ncbi:sugar ABC transporter permease [Ruminococcaceae bacterium OttesenSCG-928-D13]|nr:sugar ABC transporter permease [Ruminococcaceae bacterium OttesenSCG-928-D13]